MRPFGGICPTHPESRNSRYLKAFQAKTLHLFDTFAYTDVFLEDGPKGLFRPSSTFGSDGWTLEIARQPLTPASIT